MTQNLSTHKYKSVHWSRRTSCYVWSGLENRSWMNTGDRNSKEFLAVSEMSREISWRTRLKRGMEPFVILGSRAKDTLSSVSTAPSGWSDQEDMSVEIWLSLPHLPAIRRLRSVTPATRKHAKILQNARYVDTIKAVYKLLCYVSIELSKFHLRY